MTDSTSISDKLIPAGYLYKHVSTATGSSSVKILDFYSMGSCGAGISPDFADYINYWKHNGYWLFNNPDIMRELAKTQSIDLSGMPLFYYEFYYLEFEREKGINKIDTKPFECDSSFPTNVRPPDKKVFVGYDIVEFAMRNSPECSLLSCCSLAEEFDVNAHCLFDKFEEAEAAVRSSKFHAREPGPYRIVAVYLCQ